MDEKKDATLDSDRSRLLYECTRLDCEYEIVRCLSDKLKKHGRLASAEYVDEAEQHLLKAVHSLKSGLKWIESVDHNEQMKMVFTDRD